MATPSIRKFTIADLRSARNAQSKVPMLTCYDYSTARIMQEAAVPALLVGDSAANVILGYETTIPISLSFMIEIAAAVRRGAPQCLVVADMPFGSYQGSLDRGVKNVCRMMKSSGCDAVKIEATAGQIALVSELADAGVAVIAHLGLRPQSVGLLGGYRVQGRTAESAWEIVQLGRRMVEAGAAGILLEAVPPEVSAAMVAQVDAPVIGCGAGPACDAHVFVTHDAIGLCSHSPKFVPRLKDVATPMREAFSDYVSQTRNGAYPGPEHVYDMPSDEKARFMNLLQATS